MCLTSSSVRGCSVMDARAGPKGERLRCSTSSTTVSGSAGGLAIMASILITWLEGTCLVVVQSDVNVISLQQSVQLSTPQGDDMYSIGEDELLERFGRSVESRKSCCFTEILKRLHRQQADQVALLSLCWVTIGSSAMISYYCRDISS